MELICKHHLRARDAHDSLIAVSLRTRARALEIESQAKIRLADEYDAAQERGDVQRHGKVEVLDENLKPATRPNFSGVEKLPGSRDAGLKPKDIHEARQFRDAEQAEPGS